MPARHIALALLLGAAAAAQPRPRFTVGPVSAAAGETASGFLAAGPGADIPITILHGRQAGPTLAMVAGIHGYEYAPILALQRIRAQLSPRTLSGVVILVHAANVPSLLRRTIYYGPEDGKNLNRVFPGRADGTQSERIAHALTTEVIARADFLIDLHCGDGNESLRPYTYWMRTGNPAVDERSRQLAVAFGMDHIVIDDERPRDPARSMYCSNTAATRGKPAITVESGGLGLVEQDAIARLETGVKRILEHLRMSTGARFPPPGEPTWIVRNQVLRSEATGLFYPQARKDQPVRQGELLGTVTDFFGKKVFELRAPFAGKILYIISTPPINVGEPLAMIGEPGK